MSLPSTQHRRHTSTSKHINSNSLVYVDRTDVLDDLIVDSEYIKTNSKFNIKPTKIDKNGKKIKNMNHNEYMNDNINSQINSIDLGVNKLKELSQSQQIHLLNQSKY